MTRFLVLFQLLFCLSLPAFAQDEASDIVIGRVLALESDILGETRTIKVWLPENYAESGEAYPVFYLLDAEMVMRFAKAAATVAELGGDALPEMIVVGIENIDRNKDMFPAEGGGEGGAD